MMTMAEENQVGQIGQTAFGPVHEVVCGAPSRRALAAWPLAVMVPRIEGTPRRTRDHAARPSRVEYD